MLNGWGNKHFGFRWNLQLFLTHKEENKEGWWSDKSWDESFNYLAFSNMSYKSCIQEVSELCMLFQSRHLNWIQWHLLTTLSRSSTNISYSSIFLSNSRTVMKDFIQTGSLSIVRDFSFSTTYWPLGVASLAFWTFFKSYAFIFHPKHECPSTGSYLSLPGLVKTIVTGFSTSPFCSPSSSHSSHCYRVIFFLFLYVIWLLYLKK